MSPDGSKDPSLSLAGRPDWSGGALCIDFANTFGRRLKGGEETLATYSELLDWSVSHGSLSQSRLDALWDRADLRPAESGAVLDRALELRECLYRIFCHIAGGTQAASEDLALLNRLLAKALPHRKLLQREKQVEWGWGEGQGVLERMLWPIIESAADLLASNEAAFVRQCAAQDCLRLFIDRSRTRQRRWCDMKTCGNRHKARRHAERRRAAQRRQDSPEAAVLPSDTSPTDQGGPAHDP